jgi:hypothetical protein
MTLVLHPEACTKRYPLYKLAVIEANQQETNDRVVFAQPASQLLLPYYLRVHYSGIICSFSKTRKIVFE